MLFTLIKLKKAAEYYHIFSNKRLASNKRHLLISAAPLGIHNKRCPLISVSTLISVAALEAFSSETKMHMKEVYKQWNNENMLTFFKFLF